MPDQSATVSASPHATTTDRLRPSITASILILAAIATLLVVQRVGVETEAESLSYTIWLKIVVLTSALIAGLMPRVTGELGLALLWHALGIALGTLFIGMMTQGSLLALPPALIGVTFTAWPRRADQPLLTPFAIILLVGGFLLLPILVLVQWIL